MTTRNRIISSYQHIELFINEHSMILDTISSSMRRDEYSGTVMLRINKSNLQKEVKRCANKIFQILSASKINNEHLILIPLELLSDSKFTRLREKLFNKYKCSKIYRIPKLKIKNNLNISNKISECVIIKIKKTITCFQVITFIKCMFEIFGDNDYDVYKKIIEIIKYRFLHQTENIHYLLLEYFNNQINITNNRTIIYDDNFIRNNYSIINYI